MGRKKLVATAQQVDAAVSAAHSHGNAVSLGRIGGEDEPTWNGGPWPGGSGTGDPGGSPADSPTTPSDTCAPGKNGWTPVLAAVADGERRVQQVADWMGGAGEKPASGMFVGASGFVDAVADASDIRGSDGPAAEIISATAFALMAGEAPTVTIEGTPRAQVFKFGIPQGQRGPRGSRMLSGTSAPSNTLGAVEDWYLNTATADLYEKTAAAVWTLRGNFNHMEFPWASGTFVDRTPSQGLAGSNLNISPTVLGTASMRGNDRLIAPSEGSYILSIDGGIFSVPSRERFSIHLNDTTIATNLSQVLSSYGDAGFPNIDSVCKGIRLNANDFLTIGMSSSAASTTIQAGGVTLKWFFARVG
jgi:hypothetical protein